MFIDTHCHLMIMEEKDKNRVADVIASAKEVGVATLINVATTLADSMQSVELAKRFEAVYASVGIHPCDCNEVWKNDFKEIRALLQDKEENVIVGVGETGLDFYHKPFNKQRQVDAFKAHIEASLEHALPLIIHMRNSSEETLRVLDEYKDEAFGVAHCFVQKKDIAQVLIDWGFYLGIGGPITYPKNDLLREMYALVPLESIVLETDAPFLPPQSFRGKPNHPKYIPLIAQKIAQIRNIAVEVVAEVTTSNAKKLFLKNR